MPDKPVPHQNFATLLAGERTKAGLSQAMLAARSGISRQQLSMYERATRCPTWESVQKLALALGVSTEVFRDPGLTLPPAGEMPRRRGRPTLEELAARGAAKEEERRRAERNVKRREKRQKKG